MAVCAGCCRSRSAAATSGPGDRGGRRPRASTSWPRARSPIPPLLRAHDDATGILMAADTAELARVAGRRRRGPARVRPAGGRAERHVPGGSRAGLRGGRLSAARAHSEGLTWPGCGSAQIASPHDPDAMRASEVMVADPIVAVAGAMASEVAIMFKTRNISVVPVVDDHRTRRFLGTLSDRDIVTRCLAEGNILHTRADELMRTNTPVVRPEQELDGYGRAWTSTRTSRTSAPPSRWWTRRARHRLHQPSGADRRRSDRVGVTCPTSSCSPSRKRSGRCRWSAASWRT